MQPIQINLVRDVPVQLTVRSREGHIERVTLGEEFRIMDADMARSLADRLLRMARRCDEEDYIRQTTRDNPLAEAIFRAAVAPLRGVP